MTEIQGWMNPIELRWLAARAAEMHSIAEVGCWKGRSTAVLCQHCPGQVTAVDHWLGSPCDPHGEAADDAVYKEFTANTASFANLSVVRLESLKAARLFPDECFDMVFIDADHRYSEVCADIRAWRPKAQRLLCGHDYDIAHPGVVQAVDELVGQVEVEFAIWWRAL